MTTKNPAPAAPETGLRARVRAEALEEAAKVADAEERAYRDHAEELDAKGATRGATHDTHGALACRAVARGIRALLAEPSEPAAAKGMRCPCGGGTLVRVPTCPACGESWIDENDAEALDAATFPHVIEERKRRRLAPPTNLRAAPATTGTPPAGLPEALHLAFPQQAIESYVPGSPGAKLVAAILRAIAPAGPEVAEVVSRIAALESDLAAERSALAAAQARAEALQAERDAFERFVHHAELAYVGSDVMSDVLRFFEEAGCGKPGTPNTLWAMTQEIIAREAAARADAEKLRAALREALPLVRSGVVLAVTYSAASTETAFRKGVEKIERALAPADPAPTTSNEEERHG